MILFQKETKYNKSITKLETLREHRPPPWQLINGIKIVKSSKNIYLANNICGKQKYIWEKTFVGKNKFLPKTFFAIKSFIRFLFFFFAKKIFFQANKKFLAKKKIFITKLVQTKYIFGQIKHFLTNIFGQKTFLAKKYIYFWARKKVFLKINIKKRKKF